MTQKFRQADLVKLKSGGPIMTVEGYQLIHSVHRNQPSVSGEEVKCVWFDGDRKQFGRFHQDLLIAA